MKFRKILPTIIIISALVLIQNGVSAQESQTPETFGGKITEILEERENYQKIRIRLDTGKEITTENNPETTGKNINYKESDKVFLQKYSAENQEEEYVITDYNRTGYLFGLFILFAFMAIAIGKRRGLLSLVAMLISFLTIFKFTLPQILIGRSPFLITGLSCLFIIPVTFYLSHGFNKKTHVSVVSTLLTLIITIIVTAISISAAKLTGYSSDEAMFLQIANGTINMRGILLAGIIIGFLGVLDDVTVSQANIVFELKRASANLGTFELYKKAMKIGQDHIASMINTLILVYAGASTPLLLLFIGNPQPFAHIINVELIADEVVRTLLGSIGLILAVPLTTFLASLVADSD